MEGVNSEGGREITRAGVSGSGETKPRFIRGVITGGGEWFEGEVFEEKVFKKFLVYN